MSEWERREGELTSMNSMLFFPSDSATGQCTRKRSRYSRPSSERVDSRPSRALSRLPWLIFHISAFSKTRSTITSRFAKVWLTDHSII